MSPVDIQRSPMKPTFEFPLTVYDRPSIAIANLLSGNIDATTRAIFSPMTLTPNEMKNVRQMLLKGDTADDPVIKTVLDLATNPIVVIGLILMLGSRGRVASIPEMNAIMNEGKIAMKGIAPFIRSLSSSLTGLRAVWHIPVMKARWAAAKDKIVRPLEAMLEIGRRTRHFKGRGWEAFRRSLRTFKGENNGVPITRAQNMLVSMYTQGFHKTPRIVKAMRTAGGKRYVEEQVMSAPFQGVYRQLFGTKAPLMPDLEKLMNLETPGGALLRHAKRTIQNYNRWGKVIFTDKTGKMHNVMEAKGVRMIYEDYGPEIITRPPIERFFRGAKELTGKAYRGIMGRIEQVGPLGTHAKARMGHAIPMQSELEFLRNEMTAKHGIDLFGPGMWDKYLKLKPTRIEEVRTLFHNLATKVKEMGTSYSIDPITGDITGETAAVEEAKRSLGATFKILQQRFKMQGGKIGLNQGAVALTRELQYAAGLPKTQMDSHIKALANLVGAPPEYILDSSQIVRHYLDAMAPTYAWFKSEGVTKAGAELPGLGKAFMDSIAGAGKFGIDRADLSWIQRTVQDDLGPMLMGMKNYKEFARSQGFRDTAKKFTDWLQSDASVVKLIPKTSREKMVAAFSGVRGGISEATIGGQISSLLYSSALGLNLSPVSKNVLQTPITLIPILGVKNFGVGLKRVVPGLMKLPAAAKKYGSMDRAIRKVFPEFYRHFGREKMLEAMVAGDIAKEGQLMGKLATGLASKSFAKVKEVVMLPFAGVEKWNRLLAFYSTYEPAIAEGMGKPMATKAAGLLAAEINSLTQFTGGTIGLPKWARGVWPPFRQFGHFPSRFMEFLYGMMRMSPTGEVTTGPLGRSMLVSGGLYTIAKNLMKLDISQGLGFHAMPGPVFEGAPFYPSPYIPPIIGAAGEVIKALHTGEFRRLPSAGALFVPGGLGVKRMWRSWVPKYADYGARTPEGRIPIYNRNKALISTMSPVELAMKGMGLHPTGPEAEQQMTRYLLTQREKIREYRRRYLEALLENDLEKSAKINAEFQKKYPSLGPLQLKKSDIRAVQNRKERSRLTRILRGFPKDYRPLFEAMTEQATLAQLSEDIDFNPQSLQHYLE